MLDSFILFDSFQNNELASQHPPTMINELTFFFSKYHCKLRFGHAQHVSIHCSYYSTDAQTIPVPSHCPCILSDMTSKSSMLLAWQDVPGSSCTCPVSDLESAGSVQSPDFSLEVVFRDPFLVVLTAASWSLFLTFSVDRARKRMLYSVRQNSCFQFKFGTAGFPLCLYELISHLPAFMIVWQSLFLKAEPLAVSPIEQEVYEKALQSSPQKWTWAVWWKGLDVALRPAPSGFTR